MWLQLWFHCKKKTRSFVIGILVCLLCICFCFHIIFTLFTVFPGKNWLCWKDREHGRNTAGDTAVWYFLHSRCCWWVKHTHTPKHMHACACTHTHTHHKKEEDLLSRGSLANWMLPFAVCKSLLPTIRRNSVCGLGSAAVAAAFPLRKLPEFPYEPRRHVLLSCLLLF